MSAGRRSRDSVAVGQEIGEHVVAVRRADLVRYAGASGDFNTIHWSDRIAREVGLPDVIAHGMLTMALVGRVLSDWAGDPAAVVDYQVRFSKPVVVPDDDEGARLVVTGTVTEVRDDGTVLVGLDARVGGQKVLSGAKAVVRLA